MKYCCLLLMLMASIAPAIASTLVMQFEPKSPPGIPDMYRVRRAAVDTPSIPVTARSIVEITYRDADGNYWRNQGVGHSCPAPVEDSAAYINDCINSSNDGFYALTSVLPPVSIPANAFVVEYMGHQWAGTGDILPPIPSGESCIANITPSQESWTMGPNETGETRSPLLYVLCTKETDIRVSVGSVDADSGHQCDAGEAVCVNWSWEGGRPTRIGENLDNASTLHVAPVTNGATPGDHSTALVIDVSYE